MSVVGCTQMPGFVEPTDMGAAIDMGGGGVDASRDARIDAPDTNAAVDTGISTDVGRPDGCPVGMADCDMSGHCATMLGTPSNCASCGNACPFVGGATATCAHTMGTNACSFMCNMGFADCDMIPGNGCEVMTSSDTMNCGACTTACLVHGLNVHTNCVGGSCVPSCNSGYADCNHDISSMTSDGCEINTSTDRTNCGV